MKSRHCCALFAWTLLPLAAFAQSAQPTQSTYAPTDARAPVPAASYTSVLAQYQPAADQAQPPDQLWRVVNKEVEGKEVEGAGGGMAHMGHTGGAMTPAAKPAKPQPQPQPQPPAADPHQGHQMHHQHKGD